MLERRVFPLIQVLSVLGIALACYLLFEQWTSGTSSICSVTNTINCNAIISGPVAKTFGIPTPLYGLVGYIVLFLAASFRMKGLLLSVAIGGLLFCSWIGYREIFELRVICPICVLCLLVITSITALSVYIKKMILQ